MPGVTIDQRGDSGDHRWRCRRLAEGKKAINR